MSTQSTQDRSPKFLPTSWPLLLVAVSLAAGIMADRMLVGQSRAMGPMAWWLAAVMATSAAMTLLNFGRTRVSVVALLLAISAIGGAWHHYRWNAVAQNELVWFAPEIAAPVCLEAMATSPLQHSPAPAANPLRAIPAQAESQLLVEVTRIRDGTAWHETSGQTRLRINGTLSEVVPGDRLMIFAQLGRSRPALNPGQYDYAAAERTSGRLCELATRSPECVTVIQPASVLNPQSLDRSGGTAMPIATCPLRWLVEWSNRASVVVGKSR